jgi:hypothetical protein
MRTPPFPIVRRLELRAWPVAELHEFALIYWFRRWFAEENYLGCARIKTELTTRELAGQLSIPLLVDGFRDKFTGRVSFTDMNGVLDGWESRYPELFTSWAAEDWLDAQELAVASPR